MFRSGLLVLTSPLAQLQRHVYDVLQTAVPFVQKHLYIHLAPGLAEVEQQPLVPCNQACKQFIASLYSTAAAMPTNVDVRMILTNITNIQGKRIPPHFTKHGYDVVLLESQANKHSMAVYVPLHFPATSPGGKGTVSFEQLWDLKFETLRVCQLKWVMWKSMTMLSWVAHLTVCMQDIRFFWAFQVFWLKSPLLWVSQMDLWMRVSASCESYLL